MTIRELGIKLGYEVDKSSEKKAESSISKIKDVANKALAMIGIGFSLKGIISAIKKIEDVKKATDEAKEKWKKAAQEFDKTIGFTKTIVGWIQKLSTLGLSLFRRIQPRIQKFIQSLGGTENVLRLIAVAIFALNFTKIISFLKTVIQLLNLGSVKMLAFVAIFLIIEDFIYFILGKNSLIGEILKKNGVDVEKLRDKIRKALSNIKKFFTETWGDIKKVTQKAFEKIGEYAQKGFKVIKKFWDEHGSKIAKNLKTVWGNLSDTFATLKEKVEPLVGKVKDLVDRFNEGEDSIDIWDLIGNALEKISDFLVLVSDGIDKAVQAMPDLDDIKEKLASIKGFLQDHEQAIGLVTIAFGTLTAAIIAYNVAQAIKNAGGIVELAQLAATAIGVGALTVAESAHTVKSTIAAAATNAFGAAMAFLTSPITLVILAIGALIAIVFLLVKNWDKIKDTAKRVWDQVTESVKNAKDRIVAIASEIKDKITEKIEPIKEKVTEIMSAIKSAYEEHIKPIFDWVQEKIDALENKIANSKVGKWIAEKFGIDLSDSEDAVETSADNIDGTMTDLADGAYQSGLDYSNNLAKGIRAGVKNVQSATDEVARTIASETHHSTPDKGPLKDDDKWMPDFMNNLTGGIRKGLPKLQSTIRIVSDKIATIQAATRPLPATAAVSNSTAYHRTINQYNNFTNTFNGSDRVAQGHAAKTMRRSTDDATAALARAIAHRR